MGSGWGELTTSLTVVLLTPLTGYVLQTGEVAVFPFLVCLPLVLIHWAMTIAFKFPGSEAAGAVEKRAFAVRCGRERAALLHNVLIACAMVLTGFTQCAWGRLSGLSFGAVALFVLAASLWQAGFLVV